MNIFPNLWINALTLLFVTLMSSTVILGPVFLLVSRTRTLSAAMRCRIWIFSLVACCTPALIMAAGWTGVESFDKPEAAIIPEPVVAESDTPIERSVESHSVTNAQKLSVDRNPGDSVSSERHDTHLHAQLEPMASLDARTYDGFGSVGPQRLEASTAARKMQSSREATRLRISMEFCHAAVLAWISIAILLVVRLLANIGRAVFVWRLRFRNAASLMLENIGMQCDNVPIRLSDAISVPIVVGLFRPAIVLPIESAEWSAGQLKLVLKHELAHICRGDIVWNCIVSLINALIWFQPLAWIVRRRLREDQEFACDDAVLLQGHEAPAYATMLVNIAQSVLVERLRSISSIAIADAHSIERRIRSILDSGTRRSETQRQRITWISGLAMTLVLLTAACWAFTPELAVANQEDQATAATAARSNPSSTLPTIHEKTSEVHIQNDGYKIRDRIVDETGNGVAGATVTAEGRNLSVAPGTTDADGWFEIKVPAAPESLPSVFHVRAVTPTGDKIAFRYYQLQGSKLYMTSMSGSRDVQGIQLVPTCLQKVRVNDVQQNPIVDAVVGIFLDELLIGLSKTDAQGFAAVQRIPEGGRVFALKDGNGFDFCDLASLDMSVGETENISLTLEGVRPIKVRIVTPTEFGQRKPTRNFPADLENGRDDEFEKLEPVADVRVVPTSLSRSNGSFRAALLLNSELAASLCPQTDAAGEATISWIPNWHTGDIGFEITGEEFVQVDGSFVLNGADETTRGRADRLAVVSPSWMEVPVNPDGITELKADRLVEIRGRLLDRDGKPVASAMINGQGRPWHTGWVVSQYQFAVQNGHFSIFVAPRQDLVLLAQMPGQIGHSFPRAVVPLKSPMDIEVTCHGNNRISGLLTSGPDRTPLADRVIEFAYVSRSEDFSSFVAEDSRRWGVTIGSQMRTDEFGRYDLQVGDGEWRIKSPFDKQEEGSVTISGGFQVRKDLHSDDVTLLRTTIFSAATREEVPGTVAIWGIQSPSSSGGVIPVSRTPHTVEASSPAGKAFTVWDGQSDEMQIFVAPVVTASGQLVDDNGTPLPDRSILYMILPSIPDGAKVAKKFDNGNSGQISTDEHGKFTLTNFIQGCECQVMATNDEGIEWAKQQWTLLKAVVPKTDEPIDLGQLKIPSSRSAE